MLAALLQGLGFGLAFWIVTVPAALLIVSKPREDTSKKMLENWTIANEHHARQGELLKRIADSAELVATK